MRTYLRMTIMSLIVMAAFAVGWSVTMIQNVSIDSMAEEKAQAVVLILNNMKPTDQSGADSNSLGTGFFIDENLIVTNHHVVADSMNLAVKGKNNSKLYESEVIASDKFSDIAIIRIKDWEDYKATNGYSQLAFKSSRDLKLGTKVWSIGHPWGLVWSVTEGVVSSPARRMDGNLNFLIQTDTEIYQGNSGGPLLTYDGMVIGINDKMLAQTGGSFGLAIPSDLAMRVIEKLRNDGKVTWAVMGVRLGTSVDKKNVAVKDITPGSAGDKAGLKVDDLLLKVRTKHTPTGSIEVVDPDSILNEMAIINPGDEVQLDILRNGNEMVVTVTPDHKTSEELSK